MTVGRVYSTTINQPSGIIEVLLEKTQRERDHYKQVLENLASSIEDWRYSIVKEDPEDLIIAIQARINSELKP